MRSKPVEIDDLALARILGQGVGGGPDIQPAHEKPYGGVPARIRCKPQSNQGHQSGQRKPPPLRDQGMENHRGIEAPNGDDGAGFRQAQRSLGRWAAIRPATRFGLGHLHGSGKDAQCRQYRDQHRLPEPARPNCPPSLLGFAIGAPRPADAFPGVGPPSGKQAKMVDQSALRVLAELQAGVFAKQCFIGECLCRSGKLTNLPTTDAFGDIVHIEHVENHVPHAKDANGQCRPDRQCNCTAPAAAEPNQSPTEHREPKSPRAADLGGSQRGAEKSEEKARNADEPRATRDKKRIGPQRTCLRSRAIVSHSASFQRYSLHRRPRLPGYTTCLHQRRLRSRPDSIPFSINVISFTSPSHHRCRRDIPTPAEMVNTSSVVTPCLTSTLRRNAPLPGFIPTDTKHLSFTGEPPEQKSYPNS